MVNATTWRLDELDSAPEQRCARRRGHRVECVRSGSTEPGAIALDPLCHAL